MANYLKRTKAIAILTLRELGWSQKRTAGELGIRPDTAGRYKRFTDSTAKMARADLAEAGIPYVYDGFFV